MHLNTVAKYIRRSPYQAVSATMIMMLTFFVISAFAFLTIISVRLVSYFESRPQLTIFFVDGTPRTDIRALKEKLEGTGKTLSVRYVSKEEALKLYREQNKNDPILLDLVTADILPASLEVQPIQADYITTLAPIVKGSKNVEEVIYQKDIIDTLTAWTNAFKIIGGTIIGVLIVVSTFVILTIIGIKITIRREEIEIMKLIGASNWFIRAPFLFEGAFYGLVGAFFGWAVSYGILLYASPQLEAFLKGIPVLPISPLLSLELLGIEILAAVLLGIFASYMAVLRYLK